MTRDYYEGMFGSLKHNIILMLCQIQGNVVYAEGIDITEELKFIEKKCRSIRKQLKEVRDPKLSGKSV